jgi:hypothetical protein
VKNRPTLLLVLGLCSTAALALDKKHLDGSVQMTPDKPALEFAARYEHAINTKNAREFKALLHPASRECYRNSKHPEYYKQEFASWFDLKLESLKDFRKYKPGFDSEFYRLMKYPKTPTHVVEFNSEAMVGSKLGRGWHSIDVIEENGRYYLAYRCM